MRSMTYCATGRPLSLVATCGGPRNNFLTRAAHLCSHSAHVRRGHRPSPHHRAQPLRPPPQPRPQAHRLRQGTRRHDPPRAATDPTSIRVCFGTTDIALILGRINRGLQRANELESRVLRRADTLDAPGAPAKARSAPKAQPAPPAEPSRTACHQTSHTGTDRRPGPPPADRRSDRRYLPRSRHHPQSSALAGAPARHHPAQWQLRRLGEGHPRTGIPAVTPARVNRHHARVARTHLAIPGPILHRPALSLSPAPIELTHGVGVRERSGDACAGGWVTKQELNADKSRCTQDTQMILRASQAADHTPYLAPDHMPRQIIQSVAICVFRVSVRPRDLVSCIGTGAAWPDG